MGSLARGSGSAARMVYVQVVVQIICMMCEGATVVVGTLDVLRYETLYDAGDLLYEHSETFPDEE